MCYIRKEQRGKGKKETKVCRILNIKITMYVITDLIKIKEAR